MRCAVIGGGRMGRLVAERLVAHGHELVAVVGREGNAAGERLAAEALRGAEAAIEFTTPEAAPVLVPRLLDLGLAVVSGTTGWTPDREALAARALAGRSALLHAPNFSLGVQLFLLAARELARRLPGLGFDAHLVDLHHAAKRDAPSGTALRIQGTLREAGLEVPVTAIRSGHAPGTHTLIIDGPGEALRLEHEARDRAIFADGAIRAAAWLAGRRGLFTLEEMLLDSGRTP